MGTASLGRVLDSSFGHHFWRRGSPRSRRVRSMLKVVLTRLPWQPECLRLEMHCEDVEPFEHFTACRKVTPGLQYRSFPPRFTAAKNRERAKTIKSTMIFIVAKINRPRFLVCYYDNGILQNATYLGSIRIIIYLSRYIMRLLQFLYIKYLNFVYYIIFSI